MFDRCSCARRFPGQPGDPAFVGIIYFAQLGPLLFLAAFGGVLADVLDRRKLLIWTQLQQLVFSVLLAVVAIDPHPNETLLFFIVLAIG